MADLAVIPLIDFHTSNIQRAQTKRPARRIVRSGNPILWPPEGRSLRDAPSVNSTQKQYAFSAHKRYFVLQRLFSPHSFLARQKRMGRRRQSAPFWRKKARCVRSGPKRKNQRRIPQHSRTSVSLLLSVKRRLSVFSAASGIRKCSRLQASPSLLTPEPVSAGVRA